MDRIDCLAAFVNVFESGSFSAAARRLGTSQPTVSKRIAFLEAELGASLFLRSTRRLNPTVEAEHVYKNARDILDTFEEARAFSRNASPQPTGTLAVGIPSSLGRNQLIPLAAEFRRLYRDVALDFRFSERQVNLVEEGLELALRIGDLKDSALRARSLGRIPRFAVASPAYLREHPAPQTPDDLTVHFCIGYSRFGDPTNWVFEGKTGRYVSPINCVLKLDDADAMQAAVLEGLGIAVLPGWLVRPLAERGDLVVVLREYTVPSLPLHAVYPDAWQLSLRARRFIDFLVEHRNDLTGT